MTRRRILITSTMAGLLAVWAAALAGAQQPVFRGGIDLVNVGVTVGEKSGTFITDLRAEDFDVLEDGQKQTITYFARGDASESAPELHVGLLFDTSGSMGEDIKLARSAAVRFLNTFSDAVDMTLVDFDTEVRVSKYGQGDFPRMVERIRSRTPGGWTAMYDALGVYLDGASEDAGRKILLLYTDGGDTRSTISFGDVLTLIRASDVTIYAIGFLEHQPGRAKAEQRARLVQMTEATGGQAFFPFAMKDVDAAYDKVAGQIRAQYSLAFTSTNAKQDGNWRKVEIRVKRPDLKDLRVQARKGYFAPFKE